MTASREVNVFYVNQGGTAGEQTLVLGSRGRRFFDSIHHEKRKCQARKTRKGKEKSLEEKKMKKKVMMVLAVCLAVFLFGGCANSGSSGEDTYQVAIVQLVDNGAFTEMREAFIAKMRELGYSEDQMTFDVKDAQGDASTLNSIAAELTSSDYDLIVSIVTPATQAVVGQEQEAPVVFISVTDPVGAGIMSSMEKPDKNATGTSNIVPVDEIFGLAKTLTPEVNHIGILYCTGEANAVQTADKAKAYLEENGYTYEEVTVTNSSEVQQAAQSLAGEVDAIYIPIDSTVQTAMAQVVEAANENGIPVYGSDPVMVQSGALGCVSVSNTQLGERSAEMADEILRGTEVADVPAEALTQYQMVVSKAAAETLGISLPDDENVVVIGE